MKWLSRPSDKYKRTESELLEIQSYVRFTCQEFNENKILNVALIQHNCQKKLRHIYFFCCYLLRVCAKRVHGTCVFILWNKCILSMYFKHARMNKRIQSRHDIIKDNMKNVFTINKQHQIIVNGNNWIKSLSFCWRCTVLKRKKIEEITT